MTNDPQVSTNVQASLDTPFSPAEQQLVDLWKYFEGIGNNAKIQMTTTINWMLTFASGLFSYIIAYTFISKTSNGTEWCLHDSQVAYAGGILGVFICVLALVMIEEFRKHTFRNWWRATRCKNEVPRLHFLVTGTTSVEPLGSLQGFNPQGQRVASIFALYKAVSAGFLLLMLAAIVVHAINQSNSFAACLGTTNGQ